MIGVKDIALSQLFQLDAQQQFVLFTTRVPRTLSLIIAGSTMSISGLIMQQLTQNKLKSNSRTNKPIFFMRKLHFYLIENDSHS